MEESEESIDAAIWMKVWVGGFRQKSLLNIMRSSILTALDRWLGGLTTATAFGITVASYHQALKANRIALQAAQDATVQAQISNEIAFLVLYLGQTRYMSAR